MTDDSYVTQVYKVVHAAHWDSQESKLTGLLVALQALIAVLGPPGLVT